MNATPPIVIVAFVAAVPALMTITGLLLLRLVRPAVFASNVLPPTVAMALVAVILTASAPLLVIVKVVKPSLSGIYPVSDVLYVIPLRVKLAEVGVEHAPSLETVTLPDIFVLPLPETFGVG